MRAEPERALRRWPTERCGSLTEYSELEVKLEAVKRRRSGVLFYTLLAAAVAVAASLFLLVNRPTRSGALPARQALDDDAWHLTSDTSLPSRPARRARAGRSQRGESLRSRYRFC